MISICLLVMVAPQKLVATNMSMEPWFSVSSQYDALGLLKQRLGRARWKSDVISGSHFGLAAIGSSGGQWTLVCQKNRLSELIVGLPKDDSPVAWVSSQVLEQLLAEESDLTSARLHGAVTVEGGSVQQRQHVLAMVSRLTEQVSSVGKAL